MANDKSDALPDYARQAGYGNAKLPNDKIDERLLKDEEIRLSCCGEGVYWAGELSLTAADPPGELMPQFRRVAQAQDAKTSAIMEARHQKEKEQIFKEGHKAGVKEIVEWGETRCDNAEHLLPLLKKRNCIECWQSLKEKYLGKE